MTDTMSRGAGQRQRLALAMIETELARAGIVNISGRAEDDRRTDDDQQHDQIGPDQRPRSALTPPKLTESDRPDPEQLRRARERADGGSRRRYRW